MGNTICYEIKGIPEPSSQGEVKTINFRTENDSYARSISIPNENVLITAINEFLKSSGKNGKIRKALYELDSRNLGLYTKIKDLNIDFSSNIIVYLSTE